MELGDRADLLGARTYVLPEGYSGRLEEHGRALGRWGETDEIAAPALMLAADAGSYITGANLVIDGGCTIKVM